LGRCVVYTCVLFLYIFKFIYVNFWGRMGFIIFPASIFISVIQSDDNYFYTVFYFIQDEKTAE
jgi:hypothetical protein